MISTSEIGQHSPLKYRRQPLIIERLMLKKSFWFIFLTIMFSYPIYQSLNRKLPPALPKMHKIPSFSLINEFNKPFGTKDIKGKVVIASFMFTACPTICPGLMNNMQKIQKRVRGLGQNIALLTFSVDPENDTPEVLHQYARSLHANPYIWNFLTGTREQLKELLVDGFKVPMGEEPFTTVKTLGQQQITLWDIVHTEQLVLLDSEKFVRGYYSTDKDSINKMMIDIGLLYNRSAY